MTSVHKTRHFNAGDQVLRFYPPKLTRSKLHSPYVGPYRVVERTGAVSYKIQEGQKGKPIVVHVDDLKHYEGSQTGFSWLNVLPRIPEEANEEDVESEANVPSDEPDASVTQPRDITEQDEQQIRE